MRIIVDIPEDDYKKALNGKWIGTAILQKMMKNAIIILRSDDFLKLTDKKTDEGEEIKPNETRSSKTNNKFIEKQ